MYFIVFIYWCIFLFWLYSPVHRSFKQHIQSNTPSFSKSTSYALYLSIVSSSFVFLLKIYLEPKALFPGGRSTNFQVRLLKMDSISLLTASFQYCASEEDTASLKVWGSFSTKNVKRSGPKEVDVLWLLLRLVFSSLGVLSFVFSGGHLDLSLDDSHFSYTDKYF